MRDNGNARAEAYRRCDAMADDAMRCGAGAGETWSNLLASDRKSGSNWPGRQTDVSTIANADRNVFQRNELRNQPVELTN